MKKALLAAILLLFVAAQIDLFAQTWNPTDPGTNNWLCVASSADGHTLIAGGWGGNVAVSTNAGAIWTTNVLTNGDWGSVAASADGTKLLAAEAPGSVFLSTNSGTTWNTNSLPNFYWSSVAMSADGNTLAAVAPIASGPGSEIQAVFCSTNGGFNWVSNNTELIQTVGPASAVSVAMSADGRKIFVVASPLVCYSTNSGTSWMLMTNAPALGGWVSPSQLIASSADGHKLVMCVSGMGSNPTLIYTSADSGNTWNLTSVPGGTWTYVASSADGKTLMAAGYPFSDPSPLYISTNSGASWIPNTSEIWGGVACSADGGALVAAASSGPIFALNNNAIFRSQSIQPPLMCLAPCDSGLLLSWLVPSTNFVLEQSSDLNSWITVTNAPVLNMANLQEQVMVSATNGAGFYRLVH